MANFFFAKESKGFLRNLCLQDLLKLELATQLLNLPINYFCCFIEVQSYIGSDDL
ncbi:MAG: hypothetical protein WBJ09_01315 [Candidatus Cloacimonas acidaminovorans]